MKEKQDKNKRAAGFLAALFRYGVLRVLRQQSPRGDHRLRLGAEEVLVGDLPGNRRPGVALAAVLELTLRTRLAFKSEI